MSTFTIGSVANWYAAIADSQSGMSTTTTYQLTAPLTFSSTNPPYLNAGTP